MRIDSFEIRNYKGLARAAVEDLSGENVVVISGKNGTGKSLILEAIVSAWTGRLWGTVDNVGPWGDTLRVAITVEFSHSEWLVIDDWHRRFSGGEPAPRVSSTLISEFGKNGAIITAASSPAVDIVRQQGFQREHGFGVIDFLPATRLLNGGPTQAVDVAMLGAERVEQERAAGLDQVIGNGGPIALPNVGDYLMTLDYQRFLSERQGMTVEDEYERMASIFRSATGKQLLRPTYDALHGSAISIELTGGHRHGLNALSSGEKEMLAISYYVRRLSATGGILCVDEPEQHLHPSLQSALFENMQDIADRAQVLVVSHSAPIIASATRASLLELEPADNPSKNQLAKLSDDPSKTQLIESLGISQAALLQADAILVVEGVTDAQWLPLLFPVEVGRMHLLSAGSAKQVLQTYEVLERIPVGVPFLCVLDRDLLTNEEVADLVQNRPCLFIWPRRAIESMVLEGQLISSVLHSVGKSMTPAEVEASLKAAADELRGDVLLSMVTAELSARFPAPPARPGGDAFAKLTSQFTDYSQVNQDRAANVETVRQQKEAELGGRWATEWKTLVNPKAALAALFREVGTFRSLSDFVDALVARARDDEALRPVGFSELKAAIDGSLPAADANDAVA